MGIPPLWHRCQNVWFIKWNLVWKLPNLISLSRNGFFQFFKKTFIVNIWNISNLAPGSFNGFIKDGSIEASSEIPTMLQFVRKSAFWVGVFVAYNYENQKWFSCKKVNYRKWILLVENIASKEVLHSSRMMEYKTNRPCKIKFCEK